MIKSLINSLAFNEEASDAKTSLPHHVNVRTSKTIIIDRDFKQTFSTGFFKFN